jgi:Ca2+-transporting ATPase
MTTAKHYIGLTDAQVLESRAKYKANVLTPPKEDSLWDQIKEVCKHPIAITMACLIVGTAILAAILSGSMGGMIWVMPAIVAVATLLILIVGFFGGFGDPLFKILITAFVLSMGISIYEYEWNPVHEGDWTVFFEPIGIIVALILATSIAYFLEKKNEKTFQSLNQTNDKVPVKVYRNGHMCEVPRMDIVVGDIVRLDTGEEIPADCELLESHNLIVNESSLTGELQATKTTNPERFDANATYKSYEIKKGTTIIEGFCTAEVKKVGDATESGNVYRSLNEGDEVKVGWLLKDKSNESIIGKYNTEDDANDALEEYLGEHEDADVVVEQPLIDRMRVRKGSETPLSKKLNGLADWITNASYVLAILIIIGRIVWYFVSYDIDFSSGDFWIDFVSYLLKTIMIAVTLVVVAVPEGLPMSVTLSLAFSMRKLMKSNTLPRTMHACETMGAASVICTDKTGTLTKNRMEVAEAKLNNVDDKLLAEMIAVNSTAHLDFAKKDAIEVIGNPTEGALLLWINGKGENYLDIRENNAVIETLPFSTENKYMVTIVNSAILGKKVAYVKGAPEILLSMSEIDATTKVAYEAALAEYQHKAMRTLALGYVELNNNETVIESGKLKNVKLKFVGVFAMHDDIREGVKESIQECMKAGIAVKIVTGDNPVTAVEIGRRLGLWTEADNEKNIITGTELAKLTDKQLEERVMDLKIIARARPMDKKRLVDALRRLDQVVAVTGDGTNDAPALNAADVGLAMGNGTQVAKDASDMIIQDNSFSTIASAVMWGRSLYKNIQRFLLFQLTVNVAACFLVLFGAFLGTESPLTVTQMLWVNLIMDTFAAIALSALPPQKSVMDEKPRDPKAFILDKSMLQNIFGVGGFFFLVLLVLLIIFQHTEITSIKDLLNFSFGERSHVTTYELTLLFTIFVMTHMGYMFNARGYKTGGSGWNLKGCDGFLLIATVVTLGQIAIVQVPFLNDFFNVQSLPFWDWFWIFVLGFLVTGIRELKHLIFK